jgi:KDO2-lipid IV(A) lauroyltransferase
VAIENVERSLASCGVTRREARRIARASFRNFGRTLGVALRLDAGEPVVRWNRPNALEDLIRTHQPAMILSGHLGNWELAAWAIQRRAERYGKQLNLIVAPIRNPHASRYVTRLREKWGIAMYNRDRSFLWILRALKRRELIGTAADQYPGIDMVRRGAVFTVPFLGRDTPFTTTLFRLAERTGTRIIGISAIRANDGSYDIHTESVPTGDAEAMCRHWVRWLEMQILEYPAQYLWMHRRWKDYGT